MEKLLDIPWVIANNKWIDHRFELQSGVEEMTEREILIHSQNVIRCLQFLMGYPSFLYNQTYKPSRIYNESEHQVYNEIYTGEW